MIKRFIKIAGTGKYLNYSPASIPTPYRTTDFEKINLIYGENGSGKTTLSVILQSLRGDNNLLIKKRAFDRRIAQNIEVLTDKSPNPKFTFSNNAWDRHYPEIEIFDIHFINQNIFTGLEIHNDHKKNLFEIIFGYQGIQLKQEIHAIKDEIITANKKSKQLAANIENQIDRAYTADLFAAIQIEVDIDSKIAAKDAEINTAKGFDQIQKMLPMSEAKILNSPYVRDRDIEILDRTLEGISETYLTSFNTHKEHLSMKDSEGWIRQGYDAIKDNKCPFCKREFEETTEIVKAYNQYFNEEYNRLVVDVHDLLDRNVSFDTATYLLELDNLLNSNSMLVELWKPYIEGAALPIKDITELKAALTEASSNLGLAIGLKIINPLSGAQSAWIDRFEESLTQLNTVVEIYNSNVIKFNLQIASLKATLRQDIPSLEEQQKKLKAIKKRSDKQVSEMCSDYLDITQKIEQLNTNKEAKQGQLDSYTVSVFTSYSTKINQYLRLFAPYLSIQDFDSSYIGTSTVPMVKYALHINGIEIKQEDHATDPSFRYSLSEGDKTALALAFFLAKLDVGGNLQDKIIVFDDPVSSFDLNRKSTTISNLISFGQQAKQLFVFTHNILFAVDFWKSVCQNSNSKQCSKIEFLGTSSCIVEYDIDVDNYSAILKDSISIKQYLANGCFDDISRRNIARCIRPALESYFRLKFHDHLQTNQWLGDFIGIVRNASGNSPFMRLKPAIKELSDINDYSKRYHHSSNTNADNEAITDAELRVYCDRTLKLIDII